MQPQRLFPRILAYRPPIHAAVDVDAERQASSRPAVRRRWRKPTPPKLDELALSKPKRQSRAPRTIVSTLIHAVLIYLAVIATMDAGETSGHVATDTSFVFLAASQDPTPEPEPEDAPVATVTLNAPPKGFQTLTAPIDVPVEIPTIDFGQRFDPRDYSGRGVEGGAFGGVEGGTGPVDAQQVFRAELVDEKPEWLGGPPLEYPNALRQAGVEGHVILEFVIDTTGRADSTTLRVIEATHDAFITPARKTILGGGFRPGRVRGTKVRVLAQQRLDFNIVRRQGPEGF